jgi:hypothetical protein
VITDCQETNRLAILEIFLSVIFVVIHLFSY